MNTTFDTLTAAHALEAAGLERKQAEEIATQLRAAAVADRDTLATKADLARGLWIQGVSIIGVLTALRFLPI